jgi:hypothetical protein
MSQPQVQSAVDICVHKYLLHISSLLLQCVNTAKLVVTVLTVNMAVVALWTDATANMCLVQGSIISISSIAFLTHNSNKEPSHDIALRAPLLQHFMLLAAALMLTLSYITSQALRTHHPTLIRCG